MFFSRDLSQPEELDLIAKIERVQQETHKKFDEIRLTQAELTKCVEERRAGHIRGYKNIAIGTGLTIGSAALLAKGIIAGSVAVGAPFILLAVTAIYAIIWRIFDKKKDADVKNALLNERIQYGEYKISERAFNALSEGDTSDENVLGIFPELKGTKVSDRVKLAAKSAYDSVQNYEHGEYNGELDDYMNAVGVKPISWKNIRLRRKIGQIAYAV
jgi:hypothetical protein